MALRTLSICEVPLNQSPVLVDTNAILEACRVGCWRALAARYAVETVEDCVTETQTGWQRRDPDRRVEVHELRAVTGFGGFGTPLQADSAAFPLLRRMPSA